MSARTILSADIGGTNSRFGLFETDLRDGLTLVRSKWFKTKDAGSFGHLMTMLSESDFPLKPADADIAVIAIAGPVERGVRSAPPLIPWKVDITNAYASISHPGKSAQEILPGRAFPEGTVAVVGAGTGLGKAALVPDGAGGYSAMASEGAHANFPFVSKDETRFQEFLMQDLGEEYITANTVVSGQGLSLIHLFLTGEKLNPKDVLSRCTPNCTTTEWAARFYGRACRNFALETLACGGLYVAGGVAARSPVLVTHKAFEEEFRSSGTMSAILSRIPVFLITNEESGLWGSAVLGQQLLRKKDVALFRKEVM